MNLVRFKRDGEVGYGVVKGEKVNQIEGSIYGQFTVTDNSYALDDIQLLAPCEPEKVVCVGLNYRDHAQELDMELPEEPIIFLKPPTAVVGPGAEIEHPTMSEQVDYEAELAVVIKDEVKSVSVEEAKNNILGYTCFNDLTARDLQAKDGQWTRAKSFDNFAPLGPKIATDLDPHNLEIELLKNGKQKQSSHTSQMIFSIPKLVSFISEIMTLKPGDVIATGTPPGVGTVKREEKVEVKIEEIGSLCNKII